jgi:Polyketide cyclase / dehydrase and lipid transport
VGHPAIGKCTTDGKVEPTRTLVAEDGKATFVEIETARDEKGMSYSYAIKSSLLPLSDYKSTIKVEPKGEGRRHVDNNLVEHLYTGRRQGGQCRGGCRGNLSVRPRFGEGQGRDVRAGSVCLNRRLAAAKWISAMVMLQSGLAAAQ